MKRTAPDHKVIDIDEIDSEQQDSQSGANKCSFVWTHFKDKPGTMEVVCQVVTKSGAICGRSIKKDKSSSTKPFHTHLSSIHRISDPCLTKKTKVNHIDIKKWSQSGAFQPQVELNSETLRSALCYLIANADLPFAFVERKSFHNLVRLLNKDATTLINNINQKSIATHLRM
ncbi:hypothetical protein PGT21_007734 [Puccinia graminis f. sp. tritici]|uniref:BED-type domain-containing protein n=1 Tax=Puccinia graminis f. sp. tritici TaxID=56615 RepID=A0A5B0QER3_PUCGR|nr:hypothetical protein PGT21_007734 [Puccinia graminis f. sp. tritici]